ncbi:MAG: tripartite tricarboxylate transporter substrate binding protein, partial [Burkholderiaceae bacterium]|nr:tripartite tricarboxylate transporter substrate binding protein [Burkholderiaceae bacterium]
CGQALAQDAWPSRPITLIVAWPPGGSVDTVARLVAEPLRARLNQPVLIVNRAGAVGTIGANAVAKAAPDGYTLLMTIGAYPITAALMDNLPYNALRDLTGISLIVRSPNMLVVRPDFPAKNLADLARLAKDAPGKYTYSTAGNGTTTHLMVAMFEQAAGVQLQHIPYQGGAPSLQAVLSQQTDLNSAVTSTAAPMIEAGRLRPLAIIGEKRSTQFPDVPTFAEQGYPRVRGDSWIGLFAPGGTPPAIVDAVNAAIQSIIADPVTREKLQKQAGEPVSIGPKEFNEIVREEIADFTALAKTLNLKM